MILAQNYVQTLLILALSVICWALWAAPFKLTTKWRYELFYFDVAFGLAAAAAIYALTLGSLGFDGFSLMDDLDHAGKQQWLLAVGAGVIFNLANMILMGAIAVAGLSVAIPVGLGVSSMIGLGFGLLFRHDGNPILMFLGAVCLLVAIIVIGVAYSLLISTRQDQLVRDGKIKTTSNVPGYSKAMIVSAEAPSAVKGLLLAGVAAALLWIIYPLINKASIGELGLGPYSITVLFAIGLLFSTFVFNLFFVNLPVEGEPIELRDIFRGSLRDHLAGWIAGILLGTAVLGELVAAAGPAGTQAGPVLAYALKQAAVVIAAVWGIWVWKDFRDADARIRLLLYTFLVVFAAGVLCIAMAGKFVRA